MYVNYDIKIEQLDEFRRNTIFNISSRKLKIRLNKVAKNDDYFKFLRILIELEDVNITAKKTSRYFINKIYSIKNSLLEDLVDFIKNSSVDIIQNINYGKGIDEYGFVSNVIYIDLPLTKKQISFHYVEYLDIPNYDKDWDKVENITMARILEEIKLYVEMKNLQKYFEK